METTMEITTETTEGLTIVRITGLINSDELREYPALTQFEGDLVLDLGAVDYLDSSALGALVGVIRKAKEAGNKVILAAPTPIVLKTLRITNIHRIVTIEDTVQAAVATCNA